MSSTMCHTISEFYLWTLILFTFNNCVLLQKPNSGENPTFFNIGGVLSNSESEKNFSETIAVSILCSIYCCVFLCSSIVQQFIVISTTAPSLFKHFSLFLKRSTSNSFSHKPNRIFIESEMK
jgi:hypothetical protein